jgi:fucose permease
MEMQPRANTSEASGLDIEGASGPLPTPLTAIPVLQKWNNPRINMLRVFATFYSFIILGLNDAAYGALIPYLEEYYKISYIVISLVFLGPVAGYIGSAATNNLIHMHFGRRGVAALCAGSHLIAYAVIAVHPPYPVLVVVFVLAGYGNGLADSGWNAWIGDMANANEVLGFLHACYGLGGTISPLVATTLVTKSGSRQWKSSFQCLYSGARMVQLTETSIRG